MQRKVFRVLGKAEALLALAATALILRLHLIFFQNAGGLWRDEVGFANLASLPSRSQFFALMKFEPFLPPAYLPLKAWSILGWADSDLGLRAFGLLVGVLLLAALWANARLTGCRFPLLSLTLFGANPWIIRTGDSLRAYGLGGVFALLSLGFIWRATRNPRRSWVILAAITSLLSVHCLYQNSFLLLAACGAGAALALRRRRWRAAGTIAGIGALAALSLLPYRMLMPAMNEGSQVMQAPTSLAAIWSGLAKTLASPAPDLLWVWLDLFALALGAGAYSLLGRARMTEEQKDRTIFFTAAMLIAAPSHFALMKMTHVATYSWHCFPLMALVASCLDAILAGSGLRAARAALAALALALIASPAQDVVRMRQTNMDLAARSLETSASPDDLILVHSWYCAISFQRYYKGPAPWTTIPPLEDYTVQRWDLLKTPLSSAAPLEPILARIKKTLSAGHRVWVVLQSAAPVDFKPPRSPLPPAPAAPSGWFHAPYVSAWWIEAGYFLASHARDIEFLPAPSREPVNPGEEMRIMAARGWR